MIRRIAVNVTWLVAALAPPGAAAQTPSDACTPERRAAALQALQADVVAAFPRVIASFDSALSTGQPLEGYELSHGYAVLDGMGVTLVNIRAPGNAPQLLFYRASGEPSNWSDVEVTDPPYTLVGWGYLASYAQPPSPRNCLKASEWFIHEAGWHMRDGTMLVTPGARTEPERPASRAEAIWYWHPRAWDIHLWIDPSGTPRVTLLDERSPRGGLTLPGAFIHEK